MAKGLPVADQRIVKENASSCQRGLGHLPVAVLRVHVGYPDSPSSATRLSPFPHTVQWERGLHSSTS